MSSYHVLIDSSCARLRYASTHSSASHVHAITNDIFRALSQILSSANCSRFTFHIFNSFLPSPPRCEMLQMNRGTLENIRNQVKTTIQLMDKTQNAASVSGDGLIKVLHQFMRRVGVTNAINAAGSQKHVVLLFSPAPTSTQDLSTFTTFKAGQTNGKEGNLKRANPLAGTLFKLQARKIQLLWTSLGIDDLTCDPRSNNQTSIVGTFENWFKDFTEVEYKRISTLLQKKQTSSHPPASRPQENFELKGARRERTSAPANMARVVFENRSNASGSNLIHLSSVKINNSKEPELEERRETVLVLSHFVKRSDTKTLGHSILSHVEPRTFGPYTAKDGASFGSFMLLLMETEMVALADELEVNHDKRSVTRRQVIIAPYTPKLAKLRDAVIDSSEKHDIRISSLPKSYEEWIKWHEGGEARSSNCKTLPVKVPPEFWHAILPFPSPIKRNTSSNEGVEHTTSLEQYLKNIAMGESLTDVQMALQSTISPFSLVQENASDAGGLLPAAETQAFQPINRDVVPESPLPLDGVPNEETLKYEVDELVRVTKSGFRYKRMTATRSECCKAPNPLISEPTQAKSTPVPTNFEMGAHSNESKVRSKRESRRAEKVSEFSVPQSSRKSGSCSEAPCTMGSSGVVPSSVPSGSLENSKPQIPAGKFANTSRSSLEPGTISGSRVRLQSHRLNEQNLPQIVKRNLFYSRDVPNVDGDMNSEMPTAKEGKEALSVPSVTPSVHSKLESGSENVRAMQRHRVCAPNFLIKKSNESNAYNTHILAPRDKPLREVIEPEGGTENEAIGSRKIACEPVPCDVASLEKDGEQGHREDKKLPTGDGNSMPTALLTQHNRQSGSAITIRDRQKKPTFLPKQSNSKQIQSPIGNDEIPSRSDLELALRNFEENVLKLSSIGTNSCEPLLWDALASLSALAKLLSCERLTSRERQIFVREHLKSDKDLVTEMQVAQKASYPKGDTTAPHTNSRFWKSILSAFQQAVWLLACLMNAKMKKSKKRKKRPDIVTRATTIISCAQVTGELLSSVLDSSAPFRQAFDTFFDSSLACFAQGPQKSDVVHWTLYIFEHYEKICPSVIRDCEAQSGPSAVFLKPKREGRVMGMSQQTKSCKSETIVISKSRRSSEMVEKKFRSNVANVKKMKLRQLPDTRTQHTKGQDALLHHPSFRRGRAFKKVGQKRRKSAQKEINAKPSTCPPGVLDRLICMGTLQSSLDAIPGPESGKESKEDTIFEYRRRKPQVSRSPSSRSDILQARRADRTQSTSQSELLQLRNRDVKRPDTPPHEKAIESPYEGRRTPKRNGTSAIDDFSTAEVNETNTSSPARKRKRSETESDSGDAGVHEESRRSELSEGANEDIIIPATPQTKRQNRSMGPRPSPFQAIGSIASRIFTRVITRQSTSSGS